MKKLLFISFFSWLCFAALAQNEVKEIPKPSSLTSIYDGANVLDAQQEQLLSDQLIALKRSSSNEIAIATITTLNGGDLEGVANKTFRAWGIGSAKNNNGILILVVTDDRKVRIEIGDGLEGAIPDGVTGSIIRNDMRPYFKENDYYHGLVKAVESLSKAAVGEYNVPAESKGGGSGGAIFKFIIIAIIILVLIGRGGGGGRRGGRVMHRRGSDWLGPMIIGSMLGGGGSSGGGGGFGGGGFGGFGGGTSSGGGASGSW